MAESSFDFKFNGRPNVRRIVVIVPLIAEADNSQSDFIIRETGNLSDMSNNPPSSSPAKSADISWVSGSEPGISPTKLIAVGASSSVFEMKRLEDGKVFARKAIQRYYKQDMIMKARALADFLSHGPHDNIVPFYQHGWLLPHQNIYFIDMEYFETNLKEYIRNLSIPAASIESYQTLRTRAIEATKIAKDITNGLSHIHRLGLACEGLRGLTTFKILGNFSPGRWKIATFGVPYEMCLGEIDAYYNSSGAIRLPESLLAPELAYSSSYDNKADIWRLGLIICELFTKHQPLSSQWDVERYRSGRLLLDIPLHPSLVPVLEPPIRNMMAVNPSERPTADSLLQVWSSMLEYFDLKEFEDQFNHSSAL